MGGDVKIGLPKSPSVSVNGGLASIGSSKLMVIYSMSSYIQSVYTIGV